MANSAYWKWVEKYGRGSEPFKANPDQAIGTGGNIDALTWLVNVDAPRVFTPREHDLFKLLIAGRSIQGMSAELKLKESIVINLRRAVKRKIKDYLQRG